MNKACIWIAGGVLLVSGCVALVHAQVNPPTADELRPDSGTISDNVYENRYFGFTYTFPSKWQVIRSRGSPTAVKPSRERAYTLLFVSEPHNLFQISVIMLQAVQLASPSVTARAYMVTQYSAIKKSHYKRQGDPQLLQIGGRDFWSVTATRRVAGHTLHEELVVITAKGYALNFVLLANTETVYKLLKTTLQSISFANKKSATGAEAETSARTPVSPSPVAAAKRMIVASGSLVGSVYRNGYFGLSYELPTGLSVESKAGVQQVVDFDHDLIYGDNPTIVLAAVEAKPRPLSVPSQVLVMAEDISAYPGMTAKQVVIQLAYSARSNLLHFQSINLLTQKRYRNVRVASTAFRARFPIRGQIISTDVTYAAVVSGRYALVWMFSASSKKTMKALIGSLRSVNLQPRNSQGGPVNP